MKNKWLLAIILLCVVKLEASRITLKNNVYTQSDGRTIKIGKIEQFPHKFLNAVVMRVNPDDSPDTAFGTNGISIINIADNNSEATSAEILPDGKILIQISSEELGNVTVRLNSNGSRDRSYGIKGTKII